MKCADCKVWVRDANPRTGECRAKAPTPTLLARQVGGEPGALEGLDVEDRAAIWPLTFDDDFCGEFQPRTAQGHV